MFKKENVKIEKGKKYTYEEIENIFRNAQFRSLQNLEKQSREANEKIDAMASMMFSMTNMIAMVELQKEFFDME